MKNKYIEPEFEVIVAMSSDVLMSSAENSGDVFVDITKDLFD